MPALPQINALTGERTSADDVLGNLGAKVGSMVRSDATRGTYTIKAVTNRPGQATCIVLELLAKYVRIEQIWEWLQRTAPPADSNPLLAPSVARSKDMAKPPGGASSSTVTAGRSNEVVPAAVAPDFTFAEEIKLPLEEFALRWSVADNCKQEFALDENWPSKN